MGRGIGLEITPRAVRVAAVRRLGPAVWPLAYCQAPLAANIVVPSSERENIRHEEAFRAAVGEVLRAANARGARVSLALPDLTARLRIVNSEKPPTDPGRLRHYALWRLRDEGLPRSLRVAPAFYLNGHPTQGYVAVLVAAAGVIVQIERLVRVAGAEPVRITSTATALFNLLAAGTASPLPQVEVRGFLVVAGPSATLVVTSAGAPVFARTFRHAPAEAAGPEAAAELSRELTASLDYGLERGLEPPGEIMLAGELAAPGLAEALTQHVGIPCRLADLPLRLRGRDRIPAEGIGALAAALW